MATDASAIPVIEESGPDRCDGGRPIARPRGLASAGDAGYRTDNEHAVAGAVVPERLAAARARWAEAVEETS